MAQQRQFKQLATQHSSVKLVIPTLDVMVELLDSNNDLKNFRQISCLLQQPFVQPTTEYAPILYIN